MLKKEQYIIKGMNKDLSISKSNNEFSYENKNIRITTNTEGSLLSITNEKGTSKININGNPIIGTILGHCIIKHNLILFTKDTTTQEDYILKLDFNDDLNVKSKILYSDNLNFDLNHPIETLGIFETEDIQKVYWVDGINQIRVINIIHPNIKGPTPFDFAPELELKDSNTITKINNSSGQFKAGVIQYAFSYYNLYGQESNIFNTSSINYITYETRGANIEDKCPCSFKIELENLDSSFEYVRIYSIYRTSLNATPEVRVVVDYKIPITNSITYIDTGNTGYLIDPTTLLFKGGEDIIPYTMCHKDNTLFLANYKLGRPIISSDIKTKFRKTSEITYINKNDGYTVKDNDSQGHYDFINQLNKPLSKISTLKQGETYRHGIQFQYKTGRWSEVIFIGDKEVNINLSYENSQTLLIGAKITIDKNVILKLNDNKNLYKRIRSTIVYPELQDRSVIAQGILCPTVFNIRDRKSNSPYVQSSWFARPYSASKSFYSSIKKGGTVQFQHNRILRTNGLVACEIQSNFVDYNISDDNVSDDSYFVDTSVLTLHSPDIEFDLDLQNTEVINAKLRIIGFVPLTSSISSSNLTTETSGIYSKAGNLNINIFNTNTSEAGLAIQGALPLWSDYQVSKSLTSDKEAEIIETKTNYVIYPWHRQTSVLNSDIKATSPKVGRIKTHITANLRFSAYTKFFEKTNIWDSNKTPYNGITKSYIFNNNDSPLIKIESPNDKYISQINYYGNCNKLITPSNYPIIIEENGNYSRISNLAIDEVTDPISIKYKSSPHIVFSFNQTNNGEQCILPSLNNLNKVEDLNINVAWLPKGYHLVEFRNDAAVLEVGYWTTVEPPVGQQDFERNELWFNGTDLYYVKRTDLYPEFYYSWEIKDSGNKYLHKGGTEEYYRKLTLTNIQDNIDHVTKYGGLFLGELYRDNIVNRFGGDTDEVYNNNNWIPSSQALSIDLNNNISISTNTGDTFYQRYDCLKTYAYDDNSVNSVVDIISFMCETRVNIDGRYDRNRGNTDNTYINNTNFNLFNPIYNQKDNFFPQKGIDSSKFSQNKFPNHLIWSKPKTLGEQIDTWTNFNITTSLDLDGDKGDIQALKVFNNEIFCFQDTGLSNILFNSRVQIPTSDGVPIEISNGLKVGGKRYISNSSGCNNKWSIIETPKGLYYIDNLSSSINLFNGKIQSLSDALGFRSWVEQVNTLDLPTPLNYNNFKSFYDRTNNDVYFVNKDHCLCYSELLNQFTSFYDYKTPFMFNMKKDLYSFDIKNINLWKHQSGDYNYIYGEYKPYYINYKINPNLNTDNTFNTLEIRSNLLDSNNRLLNKTFDTLEVWNEYQYGKSLLNNVLGRPSNLKNKFRIWKVNIPRDSKNGLDRIRNPWIYLKLMMNNNNKYKMELHNILVDYFEQ